MAVDWDLVRGRWRPGTLSRFARWAFIAITISTSWRWLRHSIPRYLPKDWSQAHEHDGFVNWIAARLYLLGQSPYSAESLASIGVPGFGHPPTTAFWFLPLAR